MLEFILTSFFLGLALSMDAFSLSLANGLCYPNMKKFKFFLIPATFAFFQIVMPLIGWFCVFSILSFCGCLQNFIPLITMIILGFLGISMIFDAIKTDDEVCCDKEPDLKVLLIQGIATSLDAFSVGFTIADYKFFAALCAALIVGGVTFFICFFGIKLGKAVGLKFAKPASIFGGCILIAIGLKIFLEKFF